jgi:glycosyltransferase involved in cell wall biosynthesis
MENKPLVSIVVPTYNRLNLLLKTIDSIKRQTYTNWELILVDDISDDGTKEAMEEMQKSDSRIRYFRREVDNIPGISKYLNYGIEKAKGKYIARVDDDDVWCVDEKLQLQVDFLEQNPVYVLVGGGMIIVDENENEKFRYLKNEKDNEIRKKALMANPFAHVVVMFRKDAADLVGGYKNFQHAEDWDFWLRLGKIGKFHNLKEYFGKYLVAGQNKSFIYQRRQARVILKIIKSHRKDYPHFWKGYLLNYIQLLYTYLPVFLRKRFQMFLYYIKRQHF